MHAPLCLRVWLECVYTRALMHDICFMWFPLCIDYVRSWGKKNHWKCLNVINQKGFDWLVLNTIKWSSELSLLVPNNLSESMQALKTRFCLWKQSHADPNWLRNETRQGGSNNICFPLYMLQGLEGHFVKKISMSVNQSHARMVVFAKMVLTCMSAFVQKVRFVALRLFYSKHIMWLIQTFLGHWVFKRPLSALPL